MAEPVRVPIAILLLTVLAMSASFLLGITLGKRTSLPEPQATALQLVHQEILRSYVDEEDPSALLDRAIEAMARLDDYSDYVAPRRLQAFVEETTGTYDGIGMLPYFGDDGMFVRVPFEDGPADRAGLLPGDEIVAVDGVAIAKLSSEERLNVATERLRGPKGSTVTIVVRREDGEHRIDIERGPVQRPSVKWAHHLVPAEGLGYVHLADFHPGCAKQIEAALRRLAAAPEGLRGLVFDLRFDGGGQLDECVALARLFVRDGNIVTLRRRGTEVVERHDADGSAPWPELPIVLLVNGATASASEVLAGALQDHGRAAVVGTETYGKGYVNSVFRWSNLDFRLKLTTAHYYTPNGRNVERDRKRHTNGTANDGNGQKPPGGIAPDRVVELDRKVAAALQSALGDQQISERHRERLAAWSQKRGLRLPGILSPDQDEQLAAAIAVLRERLAAAAPTTGAATGK